MKRQGSTKRGCKQLGGPQLIKFGPQSNDMEPPYDPANELYENNRMNRNNYLSDPRNELSMSGIGKDMPNINAYNPNNTYSNYTPQAPEPAGYKPASPKNPRLSSIINGISVGVRGLSENYARNRNAQYYQNNQSNPLMGILPYNDGRSDEIKYGSNQFAMGGIYDTPKSEYGHTIINRRGNLLTHDAQSRMIHPNVVNVGGRAVSGSLKQYEKGGISEMGYRDDSPFRNRKSIDINTPNGLIDMSSTGIPLIANGRYLAPYSGMHQFDTTKVRETPAMQKGGAYVTNNSNDSRIKAYRDSLNLYNSGEKAYQVLRNSGEWDLDSEKIISYRKYVDDYNNGRDNFSWYNDGTGEMMHPLEVRKFRGKGLLGFLDYANQARYKKPIQPIVYQPETKQIINKSEPIIPKQQLIKNSTVAISQFRPEKQRYNPELLKTQKIQNSSLIQGPSMNLSQTEGDYRVQYTDPSNLRETHKMFQNVKQGDEFREALISQGLKGPVQGNWNKKFQKGGIKPYITNNPKDPRIQRYNDSLNLYNKSILNRDKLTNWHEIKYTNENHEFMLDNLLEDVKSEAYKDLKKTGIQPDREYIGNFTEGVGNRSGIATSYVHGYKKPVQPVIYQPEQYDFHGMKVDKKGLEDLKWASTTSSDDPKVVDRVTAIFDKFKVKYVKEDIPNGFKKTYDFNDVKDFINNIKPNSVKEVIRKKNIYNPETLKNNPTQVNTPLQFNNIIPQEELNYQVDYTDPTTNQRTSKRFRNEKEGSAFQALQEGNREGYYRKFQMGGANVKDFSEGWLNSPKHMEYLQNSVGANAQTIKEQRIGNLKKANISFVNGKEMQNTKGAYTRGRTDENGNVQINDKLKGNATYNTTNHELGHAMYMKVMPEVDINTLGPNYEEAHAKINSVRALGKQKEIYDPYIQDINKEQFNKLMKQDSHDMRDLIQMYGEEKAMQLLNQISANAKSGNMNFAKHGGRIGKYKRGGIPNIISYLYEDDGKKEAFDKSQKGAVTEVTAPDDSEQNAQLEYQQALETAQSYENYDIQQSGVKQRPFLSQAQMKEENPLPVEGLNFKSNGKYGTSNVGVYGAQIGNEVSKSLGYVPTFNSIFRDQAQQKDLVNQGVGAKNSYHLTGNAIDMKHEDWMNIPESKKKELLSKYTHVFHNNHDHIEPKKQNRRIGKNIKRAK